MDPFSVSTACVSLLAAVAHLSTQIARFVSGVREARRDMDAVSRELSSLALCLETLRDDSTKIQYPDGLRHTLVTVLGNCDIVTQQMHALMEKMSSDSLGRRAQWVTTGRDDMSRLRSSLEAYKSALDIALEVTAISIISAVKDDVKDVKADTAAIKGDMTQIPNIKQDTLSLIQEIGFLRLQVTELQQHDTGGGVILQRFMQESTTYAETVFDSLDEEESSLNLHLRSGSTEQPAEEAAPPDRSERVISADESISEVSDNAFRVEGVTNRISSLTEFPNVQSTERVSRRNTPDLNYTQQPLLGRRERKSPNREAMRAAAAARKGFNIQARKRLDERLEVLIKGKKPGQLRSRVSSFIYGEWFGDKVGGLQEIIPVLQAGGLMPESDAASPASPEIRIRDLQKALWLELIHFKRLSVVEHLLSYGALGDEPMLLISQLDLWKLPIPLMQSLLEYWDNPNTDGRKGTALYMCARHGATAHVSLLLEYGADPNIASFQTAGTEQKYLRTTTLNVACYYGQLNTVKVLLENGAEINNKAGFPPETPAQSLAQGAKVKAFRFGSTSKHEKIKKMLESAGAKKGDFMKYWTR